MSEVVITDQNFEAEVIKTKGPVLVDFWAEWCGPCRMQGPIVEALAKQYAGKAKVGKLEVDQNPAMAQKYGVMSIPTMMIFKNGEIVWQGIGLLLYGFFVVSMIDNIIKPKLIGDRAGVHPILVLLGVLGGLALIGFVGFIIGPLVLAMLNALIEIYEKEKAEL